MKNKLSVMLHCDWLCLQTSTRWRQTYGSTNMIQAYLPMYNAIATKTNTVVCLKCTILSSQNFDWIQRLINETFKVTFT